VQRQTSLLDRAQPLDFDPFRRHSTGALNLRQNPNTRRFASRADAVLTSRCPCLDLAGGEFSRFR
jgi:hypothetical protein